MKKNDLKKILSATAVLAAAAGTAYVVYRCYKSKKEAAEKMEKLGNANAYILGGGMSAYASALYLARDCGVSAAKIHVFTDRKYERGNAETGYICRRGKIIDENSRNFFDIIKDVSSLDIPDLTVCDEILNIYCAKSGMRNITFIDSDCNVTDISKIRLDKAYRRAIINLLKTKKETLVSVPISEVFPEEFFKESFWKLICASYGFDRGASAYEFVNAISHFDETLSGTMPADFDRSEEIIEPLKAHIKGMGIDVCDGAYVTDIDFVESGAADAIHYTDNGVRKTVYLNEGDICILPTDEIGDCETFGSFNESAPKGFAEPFKLWQKLADKHPAFKNPSVLFEDTDKNMSEEFTITLKNRLLPELIDRVTNGALGQDGVIVLDNSPWKMTICAVPDTYFKNIEEGTSVIWGTATSFDAKGERSGKAMTDCSGAEILYELVSVLNLEEAWDDIRETVVNVIPMHRKYDKSYLRPVESKLEIIPTGISNLAVSGEFTDGDGSVFTEEFAVTTAKKAAYRLCENKQKVYTAPPVSISGIKSLLKRKFK